MDIQPATSARTEVVRSSPGSSPNSCACMTLAFPLNLQLFEEIGVSIFDPEFGVRWHTVSAHGCRGSLSSRKRRAAPTGQAGRVRRRDQAPTPYLGPFLPDVRAVGRASQPAGEQARAC